MGQWLIIQGRFPTKLFTALGAVSLAFDRRRMPPEQHEHPEGWVAR